MGAGRCPSALPLSAPESYIESNSKEVTEWPRLAFLGPQGTYTHQAAYDRFGDSVIYEEKKTIADTFEALSSNTPLALIPQENSIFGSVIETYDSLRSPTVGSEKFIRDEVTIQIEHCLVVRRGVRLRDITRVLSHEQAIGQCNRYLSTHLPNISIVKTASTAAAAQALLCDQHMQRGPLESAAICSRLCITLYDGLDILEEGIQNEDTNFTRFWVLATTLDCLLPGPPVQSRPPRALVRISVPPETCPLRFNIAALLNALQLCSTRVDRRPSPLAVPFHDVYLVELQAVAEIQTDDDVNDVDRRMHWRSEVDDSIERIRALGYDGDLLGLW